MKRQLTVASLFLLALLSGPARGSSAPETGSERSSRAVSSAANSFVQLAQQKPNPSNVPPDKVAASLPNGATSISESYEDWLVECRIVNEQKRCLLSQSQGNSQTGQRIFAIEMHPPQGGKADGTILMPFGVRLESGAILKLDDKDLGKGLQFSTCVSQGCLLSFSFPAVATDAMRKGSKLVVSSLNLSSGEPISFNISLAGFGAALDRTIQLAR
jgi:invasion protein IalB